MAASAAVANGGTSGHRRQTVLDRLFLVSLDPDAVCWCFRGAVRKIAGAGDLGRIAEDVALDAVRAVLRRHAVRRRQTRDERRRPKTESARPAGHGFAGEGAGRALSAALRGPLRGPHVPALREPAVAVPRVRVSHVQGCAGRPDHSRGRVARGHAGPAPGGQDPPAAARSRRVRLALCFGMAYSRRLSTIILVNVQVRHGLAGQDP